MAVVRRPSCIMLHQQFAINDNFSYTPGQFQLNVAEILPIWLAKKIGKIVYQWT